MRLSILICHLPDRTYFLQRLMDNLRSQAKFLITDFHEWGFHTHTDGGQLEIFVDDRVQPSIGEKRNHLLKLAVQSQGNDPGYVCFVDDDDNVAPNYIDLLLRGISTGPDCCSLRGIITDDGSQPRVFEHSIRHKAYATVDPATNNGVTYLRFPNHLNCIKTEIAKRFKFPTINHGEDTDFATQIFKSGFLKTEHWIDETLYFYEHRSKK